MGETFNFSSGPSMLPKEVMCRIKDELTNWHNLKVSVMEISHRTHEFSEIVEESECDLRNLLGVPNNYKILFCQGGGRTQFSAVPMNLLRSSLTPDYIDSGYWSHSAAQEAKKYCTPNLINVTVINNDGIRSVKKMDLWNVSDNNAYLHYCPNETIDGVTIREIPNFSDDMIIVGDFSSILLSEPLNINRFDIIYAAAQKNIGISGLTIVIIHKDLLSEEYVFSQIPTTLQYSILSKNRSMFNTPPTFAWYVAGLIFQWIKQQGGLVKMGVRNKKKASLLYKTIDENDCYYNNVAIANRSYMNIPFYLYNQKLDDIFLNEAEKIGLYALKGHRTVGGMRASLYNAMPLQGVKILTEFMIWFSKKYG